MTILPPHMRCLVICTLALHQPVQPTLRGLQATHEPPPRCSATSCATSCPRTAVLLPVLSPALQPLHRSCPFQPLRMSFATTLSCLDGSKMPPPSTALKKWRIIEAALEFTVVPFSSSHPSLISSTDPWSEMSTEAIHYETKPLSLRRTVFKETSGKICMRFKKEKWNKHEIF